MRRKTRLSRYNEKKQKKTLFLSILGIFVLLFFLFKYGLPTLINFSLFLAGNRAITSMNNRNNPIFISPPIFDSLPIATNSSSMEINGTGEKDTKIELFINAKKADDTLTDENGKFSFDINLRDGENVFTARQIIKDKKSDFSSASTVIFKESPPTLEITSPSDGASFKREDKFVEVKGNTDSNVTVTVNGFYAIINETNIFTYSFGLHDGENELKVVAEDLAGNRAEKTIKVNYFP